MQHYLQSAVRVIFGFALALSGTHAPQAQAAGVDGPADLGKSLEVWTRASGNYQDGANWPRPGLKKVHLDAMDLVSLNRQDVQYRKPGKYKGVWLSDIIAKVPPTEREDTAILHFANGMELHVSLEKLAEAQRDDQPFVARSKSFSPIEKPDERFRDPRPIRFLGNKVVATPGSRGVLRTPPEGTFSPWIHVDTLTGIEYVSAAAFRAQFPLTGDPLAEAGLSVFEQRCQACHGVRSVGAHFGWDFVDPLPMFKKKKPDMLMSHVKYPKFDSVERGLMMPVQKDVTAGEMLWLWRWLKSVAEKPLQPYRP